MQSGKGKLPSSSGKKGKEPAKSTTKKHDRIDSDSDSDDGSIQLSFYSDSDARGTKTVSYTHLTLPTIYSV